MILRKSPIKRKPQPDPVTTETRATVLARDARQAGGCVAAWLETDHGCRNAWGYPHLPGDLAQLTLDHIQSGGGRMGKRAPSDPDHLVSLCYSAHLGGWATAHRRALRLYLAGLVVRTCRHVDPVFDCDSCQQRGVPS